MSKAYERPSALSIRRPRTSCVRARCDLCTAGAGTGPNVDRLVAPRTLPRPSSVSVHQARAMVAGRDVDRGELLFVRELTPKAPRLHRAFEIENALGALRDGLEV